MKSGIELDICRYKTLLHEFQEKHKNAGCDYYSGYCEGSINILNLIIKDLEERGK